MTERYDAIELTVGDMKIQIGKLPEKVLPVCMVRFGEETHYTKVATFKDEDTARWFIECLTERLVRRDDDAEDEEGL